MCERALDKLGEAWRGGRRAQVAADAIHHEVGDDVKADLGRHRVVRLRLGRLSQRKSEREMIIYQ